MAAGSIRQTFQVVAGNQNWSTTVLATEPDYFIAHEWVADSGRLFSPEEAAGGRKVVILGATVAEMLFAEEDPVVRAIASRQNPFDASGVTAPQGQNLMGRVWGDTVVWFYWIR